MPNSTPAISTEDVDSATNGLSMLIDWANSQDASVKSACF
jgi:hypothetical protein